MTTETIKISDKGTTVLGNDMGSTAMAMRTGPAIYVEVDNKFDVEFATDREFQAWAAKRGYRVVGHE